MASEYSNWSIPGKGFVFSDDGVPIDKMAQTLYDAGFLTDEEMAEEGGVPALRRILYNESFQNIRRTNLRSPETVEPTEEERQQQLLEYRLTIETNAFAEAKGVNSPEFMDMVVTPQDLIDYGIELTGRNMVQAALIAKVMRTKPHVNLDDTASMRSPRMLLIREMVSAVLAKRQQAEG